MTFLNPASLDTLSESDDYAQAEAAPTAQDLPSAGKNPPAGGDEHQRGHLGKMAQEKSKVPQDPG